MRTTKYFIYSLLVSLFSLLAACGTTTDPAEAYKGESAGQIYQGGEAALRGKDYKEAVKRFEALDAQYPFGHDAEIAQLHIIYAYYMSGEYLSAEAAADRFVHTHPSDPHVDYAYYMRGLSNYYQNMGVFEKIFNIDFATRDLTQVKKSFNDFSELVQHYPDSRYAPPAYQYMVYLRNVLADHQLQVARYYYDHEAYVASANRASMVVQYYQGAPAVPDALVMMAKSYEHLQMTGLQEQVINVIRYNYPDSIYLEQVTGEKFAKPTVAPLVRTDVVSEPVALHQETAMNNQMMYPGNGARGMQPVPVKQAFQSLADSPLFASHAKPVPPAAMNPGDVMPPEPAHSHSAQMHPAVNTLQNQAEAQTGKPAAPQQPVTASSQATSSTNGNRAAHGIGLGDLWTSLSSSSWFSYHSKTAAAQPAPQAQSAEASTKPKGSPAQAAASQQSVAEAGQSSANPQLAKADSTEDQPSKNEYPFPSNGAR